MLRPKHRLSFGLSLILLAGLIPGAEQARPASPRTVEVAPPAQLPPVADSFVQQAAESDDPYVDLDLLTGPGADQAALRNAVAAAGGEVVVEEETFVRVRVPAASAAEIPHLTEAKGVGVNQPLQIAPISVSTQEETVDAAAAASATAINFSPMGVAPFRSEFAVDGRDIVVAVIDSGVDPGHPALTSTPDGKRKIIDWKDFTNEGYVATTQQVDLSTGEFVDKDGQAYQLPSLPGASQRAYFGYLDEQYVTGYINQDLDRNGLKIDRFGVLVVDRSGSGRHDTVYVDTNRDHNFGDEQALTLFRDGGGFASLGQNRSGDWAQQRLNLVAADISPEGKFVRLGFDGLGHGTLVSGVLGGYQAGGYQGVAPGVRIMALKALRSTSSGDWFSIKEAILYAARNGASIINLSIGDLGTGAAKVFDTGATEWLDQIASQYGVLIVLAAGNSGPGLSSGATLGSPSNVIAAGAYFSPEMWTRDYDWSVPHETVWFFSGTGPRSDGTYLPSLVAPGSSPAPSPRWRDATGYSNAVGTSISTPHVSGAAALLIEAGRKTGTSYDWLSVKRALEMGARKISGFAVYEQGNGLVQLRAAYSHLQQINSRPTLRTRTADGQGGLLARSYTPGSTAFNLTNLDSDLARVGLYSSEPWVKPAFTSMLLPGNTVRQLPLELNPPTAVGLHSAFVTVTHQNKYGPSLLLPVTYVRPITLDATTDYTYTSADSLEVGRYSRFFLEVKPGSGTFTVNARMPMGQRATGNGTIQMHVFRPDGQVLHTGKIGVDGEGLSTLFQADDPVAGVWEVVIVALPDEHSENILPTYALEAKVKPSALGNQTLQFTVEPGSVTTVPVRVSNVFGAVFTGKLGAVGLMKTDEVDAWQQSVPWRMQLGRNRVVETFTLKDMTTSLQVEVSNPTRSDMNVPITAETDLTLSLYRSNGDGTWELRGMSATSRSNSERLLLSNVSSGTYRVVVTTSSAEPVQYQYRRLVGLDQIPVTVKDEQRRHIAGDVWTPEVTITAPTTPGRYTGYLQVRDTTRQVVLGWYPFVVSVGEPALRVQPMASQLVRGQPGNVVLELRDSRDNRLMSGLPVTVNGIRYITRNGQISVPVRPQGNAHVMVVEADIPGFRFLNERFTLPVKDAWGVYPLGIDQNEENSTWRRKVTTQLP